jgi:carotenoid cleavage dioxygenase
MNRRQFFVRSLATGAIALQSGRALADAATYRAFHAALQADPALGVYAGVTGDQAGQAVIEGRLPADLRGSFFRNGPGRFELGGERCHHWFDGDGFAQRWQIGDGKVSHLGRFVHTEKFDAESAAGEFLFPTFGTWTARRGFKNNDSLNAANTNLLPFAGRLFALWEGGSATELDAATLDTRGLTTWRPDLAAMPFSAHPKIDPDGTLWNFGEFPGSNKIALYQLRPDGSVARTGLVEVPMLAMVHDFAVSAAHLIFLVPPYDLVRAPNTSFADMQHWAGSGPHARPLRVVVVDKASLTIKHTYELPPRMVFHLGNAWDDGATTRLDAVLHEGDAVRALGGLMRGELPSPAARRSATVQITLDHARGTVREERLFGAGEFPRVAPQVVSRRHRALVLAGISGRGAHPMLDTVSVIDTDSGAADTYAFGAGWQVEEHILVPRAHARDERDGYLLGVAQDQRRQRTVLTVFDARAVSAGPLALAHLPYRAPHCFHGNFLVA